MDATKIREAVATYRRLFAENGIPKRRFPDDEIPQDAADVLAHCHAMLDRIDGFADAGRTGKAFRWLGFVQGCLWAVRRYPLAALKGHNRTT